VGYGRQKEVFQSITAVSAKHTMDSWSWDKLQSEVTVKPEVMLSDRCRFFRLTRLSD
jgi:hypothetical protein